MFGYIYKITNKINDKIYIGKHKYDKPELDERYITSGKLINQAINKYGIENFNREIIDIADCNDELNQKERYWILYYKALGSYMYNLTEGGDGISNPSTEITEINRQKHLGKKQSEETKLKKNSLLKKVVHTKEWCDKISLANKGLIISLELREKISLCHKNTHWYNDGVSEYMLFQDDLRILENNLIKGRLKNPFPNLTGIKKSKFSVEKMKLSLSNSSWYNNGFIEKMFKDEEIPEGFVKGRLKRSR